MKGVTGLRCQSASKSEIDEPGPKNNFACKHKPLSGAQQQPPLHNQTVFMINAVCMLYSSTAASLTAQPSSS